MSSPPASRPRLPEAADGRPGLSSVSGRAGPSLHKDLLLPGCTIGLAIAGSVSASARLPCPPFCLPGVLCKAHNAALFSRRLAASSPGLPGRRLCQLGRLPLRVFRKAHTPCVARAGPASSAAPSCSGVICCRQTRVQRAGGAAAHLPGERASLAAQNMPSSLRCWAFAPAAPLSLAGLPPASASILSARGFSSRWDLPLCPMALSRGSV